MRQVSLREDYSDECQELQGPSCPDAGTTSRNAETISSVSSSMIQIAGSTWNWCDTTARVGVFALPGIAS